MGVGEGGELIFPMYYNSIWKTLKISLSETAAPILT